MLEQGTFEGKDPFPTIFKRNKLPLDWRALKSEPGGLPHGARAMAQSTSVSEQQLISTGVMFFSLMLMSSLANGTLKVSA